MTDAPPCRDFNGDASMEPERGSAISTPRWVKMLGMPLMQVLTVLRLI